jgi:photosystem II stability/assembly factor-like uncharacterized protein
VTLTPAAATAQPADQATPDAAIAPEKLPVEWRNIGPVRGGRSIAVAGSSARPNEYYFGATGGGLWKTTDAGGTWAPVTDQRIRSSSIGAVAVCEANPDVVYAGGGEVQLRGNIIQGDGIYKSTDGGKTWRHLGLADAQTVSRVQVHPRDCDRVYVAALGHPFGPNTQRGVFRSDDGGAGWERVLYRDDLTGAADLTLDPANPDVMYASLWHAYRKPWLLNSGGEASGLFKSTDGGTRWTEVSRNPGFPSAPLGKIGVSVSGADSQRVYAIVEATGGGVFASDDGGATWTRTSDSADLRQRAFYYTRIAADPADKNTVYVLNVRFWKSTDGGRTFTQIPTPHGDNHDLWIAPNDPRRMIEGNDGGANASVDGGKTWTEQDYSTAQMYHVTTTNDSPYFVCGSQQDNDTACVSSEGNGDQAHAVGGGESGYLAVDPRDSNFVYGGSYGGYLTRYDRRTGQARNINPWPDNPMGHPAKDLQERFQWTFPIMTSPADPTAVYAASQHIFRSTNNGQSWQAISPDLTRADPETMGDSGGPITKDQTSIEYYATVFAVAPSPINQKVIWAGSDDGLVHVTRNLGRSWTDATPEGLPRYIRMSMIDAGHRDDRTAYVAAHRYRLDDRAPYLFRTHDGGKSWKKITDGIPDGHFTWAIREDPKRAGLLYAGTEHGIYVSFNDGRRWYPVNLNLPDVQVSDITIKDNDVVVATHGRGFYVLDNGAGLLRALAGRAPKAEIDKLAAEATADRTATQARAERAMPSSAVAGPEWISAERGGELADRQQYATGATAPRMPAVGQVGVTAARPVAAAGDAPPVKANGVTLFDPADPTRAERRGVGLRYNLDQSASSVTATILDAMGNPVRTLTGLPTSAGEHTATWDLRHTGPVSFPGLIYWAASPTRGPLAPLGEHTVKLTVDGAAVTQQFTIMEDPRLSDVTAEDIARQFALASDIVDAASATNQGVIEIRACRTQVDQRASSTSDPAVRDAAAKLRQSLTAVEEELYQTRLRSSQDPLNYPIKLNNRMAALLGVVESAEARPTDQSVEVFQLLSGLIEDQLTRLRSVFDNEVPGFNQALARAGLEPVSCG